MHDLCLFQILPRVLYHTDPSVDALGGHPLDAINKEILYECMIETVIEFPRGSRRDSGLGLNYYEVQSAVQSSIWVQRPGFEVLICFERADSSTDLLLQPFVADPVDVPGLREYYGKLPQLVESTTIAIKEPVQKTSSGFQSDPFELLPYEIRLEILSHLPIESVVSFQVASRAANFVLSNGTWRRRIQNDMPWLWELFEDDFCKTTIDWKKVYVFLDFHSRFESCYYISGLVNRRRIWKICSQIAVLYASKTASQKPSKSGNEDISKAVASKTRYGRVTRVPRFRDKNESPDGTHFTTFMLLGLGDLHHGSSVLRTYWNDDDRLTGVSMTMKGRSPRLFGHETPIGNKVKSIVIEEGDWLQKLTVTCDYSGIKALKVRTSIKTPWLLLVLFPNTQILQVTTSKSMSFSFGCYNSVYTRILCVRPGMVFAGLRGETLVIH